MGARRKQTAAAVETNYGSLRLADGTLVTFLLQPDGTRVVVTPESLAGKRIVMGTGGWKVS